MNLEKLNKLTPKEIDLCKLFMKYKGKKYLICNELKIKRKHMQVALKQYI